MKLKSTYKLTERYFIDEVLDNKCKVTIVDLTSETIEQVEDEVTYLYDATEIEVVHNEEYIKDNLDVLCAKGIAIEKREEANEEIARLKEELSSTDYKAIKFAEGWLTEEEYAPIKAKREELRERIRALEN